MLVNVRKIRNKKQNDEFLPPIMAPLAALLLQPVISSVVKGISRRWARKAGRV